jgi:endo-1,4-beta-xylanase
MAVSAGNESRSFLGITEQQNTISQHFSQLTAGNIMKMSYLHPSENTYTYTQADNMIAWAASNGLSVHGHTFIWHSSYQVPTWMVNYTGDFAAMLNTHVSTIATYFADKVVSWDVVNEALDESRENCYRNSLFYQEVGAAYIANAFIAADAADSDADLYYNDYGTEDSAGDKFDCLLTLVDGLVEDDVPIDGVGFQLHVQMGWPSIASMKAAFEAIVARGLKVKITELDIPLNNYWTGGFPQYETFTNELAEAQKQRYKAIVEAYLEAVPENLRGGITVWGLWDGDSWLISLYGEEDWPLLFTGPANGPYEAKPAFYGVAEALAE